jgi:LysM repeat protein
MIIPSGKLGKLRIISFRKPEMNPTDIIGILETLINPEGYSREYGINYNEQDTSQGNDSSTEQQYSHTTPESMEFRFVFDRTGAMPNSPSIPGGVVADIALFKELTYEFKGDMHRPPYLKLIWGTLIFPCVLKTMNIQYKLFKPDGTPIRAEIQATFKKFEDFDLRSKILNLLSPDLTHIHEVKTGDTLPLLAHNIYGDAKHYLEVARINNLVNFKTLTPGQKLVFPPLEK